MRRAAIFILAAVVVVPVALAANGEPKHAYTRADQARARAASLRLTDFGAGWQSTPASSSDSSSNPRCSTYNPNQSDLVETGKYDSPDFTRTADNSFVSVSTGVFRSVAMAGKGYARVAVRQLPACFGELFVKGIKKPNSARIVSSGPIAFPRVGDRSNAYRLVVSVSAGSVTVPATADLVLFNKGRVDVAMIFLGIAKPLPATFERSAVGRVLSRVR